NLCPGLTHDMVESFRYAFISNPIPPDGSLDTTAHWLPWIIEGLQHRDPFFILPVLAGAVQLIASVMAMPGKQVQTGDTAQRSAHGVRRLERRSPPRTEEGEAMSPLRGEEFTGRTVEEAIERGLRALGRKRTEVDIEILEKGKPANVLGMGGEDARVLLSFQEEERPAEPDAVIDEAEVPRHPGSVRVAREEDSDEASPAFAEELALGAAVLRELLEAMGVDAEVTLEDRPGSEGVDVLGTDLGALIGRGGENLVALQQIVSA